MKTKEKVKEITSKIKGGLSMKNWSLKKKLLVGAGVLGTAFVGVLAYGKVKQDEVVEYNSDSEDEDDYDYESEDEEDETETETEEESKTEY